MRLDAVIFGGGAAGLWILDALARRGKQVVLLESDRLGAGQTISSQGILHGGLKYTLHGILTRSAAQIREMPQIWRECLDGRRLPDLRATRVRASACHLWRTDAVGSRLGMIGARVGLRVSPSTLRDDERPAILAQCPGSVALLEEQVIAPESLLHCFAQRHKNRLFKVEARNGRNFNCRRHEVRSLELRHPGADRIVHLEPKHVIFAAGKGNAELRREAGLPEAAMQRRPLHMVLLRGHLPILNGHCVDKATTRVTITSDRDSIGRTVWQVGGEIAESGILRDEMAQIQQAKRELEATIPGIDLSGAEWTTDRVDRAEGATPDGARPETIQIRHEGNILTVWPTKLAFVPLLAEQVATRLESFESETVESISEFAGWPRPQVAVPLWDSARAWCRPEALPSSQRRAA
jgi:glycerol-3-phosphate dehydrogenase